ncbi:MAG: ARC6/PARC6 family protein [Pseudanabaenaceae cyanobacterium]
MKVAFDCYKALGVTPQATPQELEQGYYDRLHSLPHREYSEQAIQQRNELLAIAFSLITRGESPTDVQVLDLEDDYLAGLLLLLLELGEYQQVLELGLPLFERGKDRNGHTLFQADILLSVGRAYLEIARELRQQVQYEQASQVLETAQALLTREGGSIALRSEMQRELYLMRPYRILELLSAPDHDQTSRQQGLRLLEELISDRLGIDGSGNDRSELKKHDFLAFLQQVRTYLTAKEQQALFEAEARRPSAVASYLAAYALIAEGFATHQPSLIRRAKGLFVKLGHRQDTYLEQALCCLLLGQTDTAIALVKRSRNETDTAYIYEQSEPEGDLLVGLCKFCEKWLKEEVYPYFRDLQPKTRSISLKVYFADPQVQEYLDNFSDDAELPQEWVRAPYPSYRPPTPPPCRPRPHRRFRFNLPLLFLGIAIISLGSALWLGRTLLTSQSHPSPTPTPTPIRTPTPLDPQTAYQLVLTWQKAKASARSSSYDLTALEQILTEPELSQWRQSIQALQKENRHYEYTLKSIDIKAINQIDPDTYTITAEVAESRTLKQQEEIIQAIDAQYETVYEVVRHRDRWLIRKMESK